MMENGGHKSSGAFGCLVRRKRVDAARQRLAAQQLARKLSLFDLIAIGNSYLLLYVYFDSAKSSLGKLLWFMY